MITKVSLKSGSTPTTPPTVITTSPVTIFVGPNNSGKSRILFEIHRFSTSGQADAGNLLIGDIEFSGMGAEQASQRVAQMTLEPGRNEALAQGNIIVGKRGERRQLAKLHALEILQNPNSHKRSFCPHILVDYTLILNGRNRIDLVNQQSGGDLQTVPTNSLQVLFRDDQKRKEVRRIVHDAFGGYFIIDPTNLGTIRIKMSSRAPVDDREERGIDAISAAFHSRASSIEDSSDGVKAFTGIILETIAGDPEVLLIDEPEAFLHPPLAYKLGKELSSASQGSHKRIFVSTHSSSFLMGCIQSGVPVNIVRLTYRNSVATSRLLHNDDLLKLMRNPLLRSTGVLEGVFYEHVVVTEGDADRAFYQEINNRLLQFKPEWGIPNCLFLNAQNKQTIHMLVKPLRELGIPTAAIYDVDILKEGGTVWSNALKSGFIPEIQQHPMANTRAILKGALEAGGRDMKKDGGINLLETSPKEAANNLFDQLEQYGLFTVREGELESWLKHLGITGHSPEWLVSIFERIGEDTESATYLKPANNDVWAFIGNLKKWFVDQNRKGMPA